VEYIKIDNEEDLIKLLESEKIDSLKFKKNTLNLFNEIQNNDCKIFKDLTNTIIRAVCVVQLILIDKKTGFFLMEEYNKLSIDTKII